MVYDFIKINTKKQLTIKQKELKLKIRIDWQDASSGYIYYKQLTDDTIKSINM